MSEMVHYTWKIKEIHLDEFNTYEELAKSILDKKGFKKLKNYDNYIEALIYEYYDEYIQIDWILFEIITKDTIEQYNDIFKSNKNEDETISYEVKYYNGWCSFEEAMWYALQNK